MKSMRDERNTYSKILVGKHEGKRRMEDPGAEGGIMLKCVLKKYGGSLLTGFSQCRIAINDGLL